MPFVAAPNIVMVEIRALKDSQRVENRIHINCLHEPTQADFTAINTILSTNLLNVWLNDLPSDLTLTSIFYRSLESENAPQFEAAFAPGTVGTAAGTPAPNQNTFCVSLRTGGSGRSARGRLYWLGLSEDQYTGNVMAPGAVTNIIDACQSVLDDLSAANYIWSVVSFRHNNAPRVGGPVYFTINSILAVDNILDSQRRRMPGRGS